ncbi:MAG: rhodanese-like domain-containing protein [Flavobacteriales bacterium]|nr:rhodanese-like domain-containing protein [Flavobacteriales bacterium]
MLRSLFGIGPKVDLKQVLTKGALILDVRTPAEYTQGHVQGSINIPLDVPTQNLHKLDKTEPVITCCRSGMRSGQAVHVVQAHGSSVYNGGPWTKVDQLVKEQCEHAY